MAFDAKALRGTYGHQAKHQPAVHLCSFYEVSTGMSWQSAEVEQKKNEISAVKGMLTPVLVKGRIISADAMHTRAQLSKPIVRGCVSTDSKAKIMRNHNS